MAKSPNTPPRNGDPDAFPDMACLTESEYHRLLSVERRRLLLEVLAKSPSPVELADLAATVAARENEGNVVDQGTVEQVIVTLHHTHLPMMADLCIVDYDLVENVVDHDLGEMV